MTMLELEELLQTRAICETEYKYVLFHGTPEKFERVDMSYSEAYTDFGKGFYLTTILEQAVEWAGKKRYYKIDVKKVPNNSLAYVLKFELLLEKMKKLNIRIYEGYTEEWLDKVCECRTEGRKNTEDNDVTIGPMADNNISSILHMYRKGQIGKQNTIDMMKFHHPNMQIAFHTDKALNTIKLINHSIEFH